MLLIYQPEAAEICTLTTVVVGYAPAPVTVPPTGGLQNVVTVAVDDVNVTLTLLD